jgi:mannan endo-1,4-beta-mannosidase
MTIPPQESARNLPPQSRRAGRHSSRQMTDAQNTPPPRRGLWRGTVRLIVGSMVTVAVVIATVVVVTSVVPNTPNAANAPGAPFRRHHIVVKLSARPDSYLGAYASGVPRSYAPIQGFNSTTGIRSNIAVYYSGWWESFESEFATAAARNGAIPLIQIDPGRYSLRAIAAGGYDTYLETFANAVAGYGLATGHGVIIGFGHEPNGSWYPWGRGHVSPATWVAAWRHIVNVFRRQGADNVTWLWTINIIDTRNDRIPAPSPWWPGSSYVNWVGIDGYYLKPNWTFASLFGPTIKAIRALTLDPILISETGATPTVGQPAKINDLFAGVHAYGLLGFVWFDAKRHRDWRVTGPAASAAFRRGVKAYRRPVQ